MVAARAPPFLRFAATGDGRAARGRVGDARPFLDAGDQGRLRPPSRASTGEPGWGAEGRAERTEVFGPAAMRWEREVGSRPSACAAPVALPPGGPKPPMPCGPGG